MKKAKNFLLYWGVRLILGIMAQIPWELRKKCGFILGKIFARLQTKMRLIADLQLDLFLPDQGGRKLTSLVFGNMGRNIMEGINLKPILSKNANRIVCQDESVFELLTNPPNGIVALTAHIGNWDLLAAYLIKRGVPLMPIGRPARSPAMQRILTELRTRYGIETIWRAGSVGIRDIISSLQQRKIIAALVDQDTNVSSAVVPFFNRPASTPIALINIAKKYNFPIMSGFLIRSDDKNYKVFIDNLDTEKSAEEIMLQFNQQLEALIRRYPCQWAWIHKRWRTIAPGVRLSSRNYVDFLQNELRKFNQGSQ